MCMKNAVKLARVRDVAPNDKTMWEAYFAHHCHMGRWGDTLYEMCQKWLIHGMVKDIKTDVSDVVFDTTLIFRELMQCIWSY